MSQTLEQIDRELIKLLGKRISCLTGSQHNSCGDLSEVAQELAQAGIPEFVWQNLTINCAAASSATTSGTGETNPAREPLIPSDNCSQLVITTKFIMVMIFLA